MKSSVKIALIIALVLFLIGACLAFSGMLLLNFDFSALSTEKPLTSTHEITNDFDCIHIDTDVASVTLLPAEDGVCRVICEETEKTQHSVTVQGNALYIEARDTRQWYEHIGIFISEKSVSVYLPKTAYTALVAETDTGNIRVETPFIFTTASLESDTGDICMSALVTSKLSVNTDTGSIDILTVGEESSVTAESDTGKIQLTDVLCRALSAENGTGAVYLTNSVVKEKIRIKTGTGNVHLQRADASELEIRTGTGNISGTLLSEKRFITDTSTGKIRVPATASGGICELKTSTGDIDISIISE